MEANMDKVSAEASSLLTSSERVRGSEDQPTIGTLEKQVDQLHNELKEKEGNHLESLRLVQQYSRENALMEVERLMVIEFGCSICNDIFIDPAVLECGHTFCNFCINRAMDLDVLDCPLCRNEINVFPLARNNEMRNFIDKIHEIMPEKIQTSRESTVKERLEMSQRPHDPWPSSQLSSISSLTSLDSSLFRRSRSRNNSLSDSDNEEDIHPSITSVPTQPEGPVVERGVSRQDHGITSQTDSTSVPPVSYPVVSFVIRPPPLSQTFEDLFTRREN